MNHQDILEKAIRKAIDGGWRAEVKNDWLYILNPSGEQSGMYSKGTWGNSSIIFNHDFAKALWGEGGATAKKTGDVIKIGYDKGWKYHLQQMVIAEDPIKYLGENL